MLVNAQQGALEWKLEWELSEEAMSKADGSFGSEANASVRTSTNARVGGLHAAFSQTKGTLIQLSEEAMSKADGSFGLETNASVRASRNARVGGNGMP